MKLESWHSTEDKRRWKIVRTDDYTDVAGDIITADEATGASIVRRALEAAFRRPKPDFATINDLFHPDHEFTSRIDALDLTTEAIETLERDFARMSRAHWLGRTRNAHRRARSTGLTYGPAA